jgi:ribosome biogenesis GTPase
MSRSSMPAEALQEAQVVAAHGRHLFILDAHGLRHAARVFGRGTQVVCGDRVTCRRDEQHDIWHVLEALPRRSAIYRSDAQGRPELVAANIDLLVVVTAAVPEPDWFVIDRYLAAAASAPARALLVHNKSDLPSDERMEAELAHYQRSGYPLLRCSTRTGAGLEELRTELSRHASLLVGQSGVGKSSLLQALVPDSQARVGELMRDRDGRHTTTATSLHGLPGGGELLDSPGVRDFAPAPERLAPPSLGFIEIDSLQQPCRFSDCRHLEEPGCAVRAAVETGQMTARRYESYRRLRRLYDDHLRRVRNAPR